MVTKQQKELLMCNSTESQYGFGDGRKWNIMF